MSHGPSGGDGIKAEPNLIPLLDLVMQLVMFFMVCANFVMEQTNATIVLPEAIASKALDKNDAYPIFLNINKEGKVLLSKLDARGGTRYPRAEIDQPYTLPQGVNTWVGAVVAELSACSRLGR